MLDLDTIYNMDCLEGMKLIDDGSIDLILADLPYETTQRNRWDKIIPFEPLWEQYWRILKKNGAIVLTSQQPFTTKVIVSQPKWFRYEWIWEKDFGTGFLNCNKMPLKCHENILVFYKKLPTYNPQFTPGKPYVATSSKRETLNYREGIGKTRTYNYTGRRYPRDVLKFQHDAEKVHATQKPVALFEYMIKTYTNEGELVLDNVIGSGTTALACKNTGRHYLGFEADPDIYKICMERINGKQEQRVEVT